MFIIVTYPWPVPSAHVELTGLKPPPGGTGDRDAAERCDAPVEPQLGPTPRRAFREREAATNSMASHGWN